jgi:uncharacterized membrane protein YebE (DUF533 family)
MSQQEEENKEEFCGSCLTVPLAMAATGGGVAGASSLVDRQKHKKLKKTIFIVGIVIAVLSILYSGYVLYKQSGGGGKLAVCSR